MQVTFPITITSPGGTINIPFGSGTKQMPDTTAIFTAEVNTDDLVALFPGTGATVHLTAAQLRAQYTDAELLAALQSPKV